MVSMSRYEIVLRESRAFRENLISASIDSLLAEGVVNDKLEYSCARLARSLQKFKPKQTPTGLKLPVHPDFYEAFTKALAKTYGFIIVRAESLPFHMQSVAARLQNIKALSSKDYDKAYNFVNAFDNYIVDKEF